MLFSRALLLSIILAPLALAQSNSSDDDEIRVFPRAPTECQPACDALENAAMDCSIFGGSKSDDEINQCICKPAFAETMNSCKSCLTPVVEEDSEISVAIAQAQDALGKNCPLLTATSSLGGSATQTSTASDDNSSSSSSAASSGATSSASPVTTSSTSNQSSSAANTATGSAPAASQTADNGNGASSLAAGGVVSFIALAAVVVAF